MTDPRRHAWSRPGLEGRRACPASTTCSVGETLTFGPHQGEVGAGGVVEAKLDPVIVTEIELGQIAAQVRFRHVEVTAIDIAFR
jgi:hypothetical protein